MRMRNHRTQRVHKLKKMRTNNVIAEDSVLLSKIERFQSVYCARLRIVLSKIRPSFSF